MASSSNPYENYNPPHVEDDSDLIDPDDGMHYSLITAQQSICCPESEGNEQAKLTAFRSQS
jgi:hypothetical protein